MATPKVTFEGRLGADPELRFTPSGKAVVNFNVACSDRVKDESTGEWKDGDTTWLRCSLWEQAAENAAESLVKGMLVHGEGKLKQREYEKDGVKHTAYDVNLFWVAPSIRWDRATITKTERTEARTAVPASDPWGSAPPQTDEPPF